MMPEEVVSSLLQAANVGGNGSEQAAPATKEQKLKNARLNAATSRHMPLEHHRQSNTSKTDVQALRLLSDSCDERTFAKLQAVAPSSCIMPDEDTPALASQMPTLEASEANDRAAATWTASSRPKYTAENMRNTTA